jgi:hypothetical protein
MTEPPPVLLVAITVFSPWYMAVQLISSAPVLIHKQYTNRGFQNDTGGLEGEMAKYCHSGTRLRLPCCLRVGWLSANMPSGTLVAEV